jgi:hypothetical protein
MLVIEDRNRPTIFLENVRHLLEELIAGILLLSDLVLGIVAVLADNQDGIHGELVPAATQCLGDLRIESEAELLGALLTQVVGGRLIDVDRNHVQRGLVPFALDGIADEITLPHVPGVRAKAPLRGHDGHFLARAALRLPGRQR